MKCIAIDDEPFALNLICDYIKKTPFLEFSGAFSNPIKAMTFLISNPVDLIFLDINMPELSGFQMLNSLLSKPNVIFTTAYSEFGAESYNYDAIDYLMKPVKYERFLKAVNKVSEKLKDKSNEKSPPVSVDQNHDFIYIKSGTQIHKVRIDEILYVEGAGNYMAFYIKGKKILSLLNMKEVLDILPAEIFIRIHKSYIVSINHIELIENYKVVVNKIHLPIGITYKENFFSKIGKKLK